MNQFLQFKKRIRTFYRFRYVFYFLHILLGIGIFWVVYGIFEDDYIQRFGAALLAISTLINAVHLIVRFRDQRFFRGYIEPPVKVVGFKENRPLLRKNGNEFMATQDFIIEHCDDLVNATSQIIESDIEYILILETLFIFIGTILWGFGDCFTGGC